MTEDEIISDFPELTKDDIHACLSFAADRKKKLSAPVKLVFDQNPSFKLSPILDFIFPGSKYAKDFGLTGNDDDTICPLALERSFVIVPKDSNFLHQSLLR